MDDKYRTQTVLALCRQMRDTEDYSAMPVLADALSDAGCADESFLAEMRRERPLDRRGRQACLRLLCVVESDAGGAALARADALAADLEISYGRLMDAADTWVDDTYRTRDDTEIYKDVASHRWEEFWADYAVIAGRQPPEDDRHCFFTCSC